jgi:hypothetical protein
MELTRSAVKLCREYFLEAGNCGTLNGVFALNKKAARWAAFYFEQN